MAEHPRWFQNSKVIIPTGVVDGLNLLWYSDLVVSGGGTMNREAATLGVPAYSIFRGRVGAVDRSLQAQGKLVLIENSEDVRSQIILKRRPSQTASDGKSRRALHDIVDHVDTIQKLHHAA